MSTAMREAFECVPDPTPLIKRALLTKAGCYDTPSSPRTRLTQQEQLARSAALRRMYGDSQREPARG